MKLQKVKWIIFICLDLINSLRAIFSNDKLNKETAKTKLTQL